MEAGDYPMKPAAIFMANVLILFMAHACVPPLPKQGEVPSGRYRMDVEFKTAGFSRKSLVYIPPGYDPAVARPLVVVLHGAFSNAAEMEEKAGFFGLADREGGVVLYPEGIGILGYLQHWNAGHCCGKAEKDGIDDIGFLDAAIDNAIRRFSVDAKKVYLVGHSNGGMLAHRYAVEKGERLAGVAAVSAAINSRTDERKTFAVLPNPKNQLPVCIVHGLDDDSIPYTGGKAAKHKDREFSSVADATEYWLKGNGCQNAATDEILFGGRVKQSVWKTCNDNSRVAVYSIEKWGHDWPGRNVISTVEDEKPFDFDAAEIIWEFFSQNH